MHSICSFWYVLISSLCGFLSFCALALVGSFYYLEILSPMELCLALGLVGMHSVASMEALMKFSYLSVGVSVLDISWRVLNLFFGVLVYLLLIFLLLSEDQSYCVGLTVCIIFLCRFRHIFAVTILWLEDNFKRGICLTIQIANNLFLIYEDLICALALFV